VSPSDHAFGLIGQVSGGSGQETWAILAPTKTIRRRTMYTRVGAHDPGRPQERRPDELVLEHAGHGRTTTTDEPPTLSTATEIS
jgi:hypothetical protein